jgi:hypothetical protein
MEGVEALPRKNASSSSTHCGKRRAFGMAAALNEQATYAWREFRDQLVDEITAADAGGLGSISYERSLAAFEKLAVAQGRRHNKEELVSVPRMRIGCW